MTALARAYSLPLGFTVEFVWNNGRLDAAWRPDFPRIRKPRAWKKFFAAYKTARRSFYEKLAAVIGGNILVADTPDFQKLVGTEIIDRADQALGARQ